MVMTEPEYDSFSSLGFWSDSTWFKKIKHCSQEGKKKRERKKGSKKGKKAKQDPPHDSDGEGEN